MNAISLPCTLVLACLAACGASPAPTPPAPPPATEAAEVWLAQFHDALQFVPDGMASYWFHRSDAGGAVEVRCARTLRWSSTGEPMDRETVTVTDAGSAVLPVRDRISSSPDQFLAIVDGRFVVTASREWLGRAALKRSGAPRLDAFGPLLPLEPSTTDLVLQDRSRELLPQRSSHTLTGAGGAVIAAVMPSPPRAWMWGRDEAEVRAMARCCFARDFVAASTRSENGIHVLELALVGDPMLFQQFVEWSLEPFFGAHGL